MTLAPFVPAPPTSDTTTNDTGNNTGQDPHNKDSNVLLEQINKSISAVSAATYSWDIASDSIGWHGNLEAVFGQIETPTLDTGRAYASLLDPDNFTSRFETVMRNTTLDEGNGVPFSIEYSIKPYGRDSDHSIWVEDIGRWYAGQDGRPNKVFGIVRQIDDRHERDQHLQFMGNCDPLTGMMNRGRLTEALGESIESLRAQNLQGAFLIVAISNLEVVNDAYGFEVADEVVTSIGKRLRQVVRTGDVIGRYSGSKFSIILAQATPQELEIAAERFLSIGREQVIETDLGPVWASLSIGALTVPYENDDATTTMSHAEEALAEAKKQPTDGFIAYEPSKDVESERQLNSRCAVEIVHSLKDQRFTLAYQPIFNVHTQQVEYYEALLRMRCESGEVVPAGHLVPIAEKLGLIRLIDQAVISNVLTTLRQHPDARIALNISGVTANDPRWFGKLTDMLAEHSDLTDRLTIEITETVALENIDQTVKFIEKLHDLGCKVAIDDFGAGFTSFRNLKTLNVDKVKIDGSFCVDLSNNPENQFFVKTLIELAKNFDLLTVAEWVENQQDADLLTSWGVDYLQGRLHGMAKDGSQWGEPVIDAQEVYVAPSEIFNAEGFDDEKTPAQDDLEQTITHANDLASEDLHETTNNIEHGDRNEPEDTAVTEFSTDVSTDQTEQPDVSTQASHQSHVDDNMPFLAENPDVKEITEQGQEVFAEFAMDENFDETGTTDLPFQFEPNHLVDDVTSTQTPALHIPDISIDHNDQVSSAPIDPSIATSKNESSEISPENIRPEEIEKTISNDIQVGGVQKSTRNDVISENELDDELKRLRETIKFLKPADKAEPEAKNPQE